MPDSDYRLSVLVAEDESLVRMILVDVLEEAGFKMIEAATGDQGLRELEKNPDLKALLTDVEMPGRIDGITLARITSERYPEAADLPLNARFFDKPYRHEDILTTLHDLMGRA